MARVKYDPGELDQNFQIEDGIRRTLSANRTAEVSVSVIESSYDLLADNGDVRQGSVESKCAQLGHELNVEYVKATDDIVFRSTQDPRQ